jgi:hypothetical protein
LGVGYGVSAVNGSMGLGLGLGLPGLVLERTSCLFRVKLSLEGLKEYRNDLLSWRNKQENKRFPDNKYYLVFKLKLVTADKAKSLH